MAYPELLFDRLHRIFLFASLLYTTVCATESTARVSVSVSNHRGVELTVNANGDFAYQDLQQQPFINNALIRDNSRATCFFWRDVSDGRPVSEYPFASVPFTQHAYFAMTFGLSDRIYCYDDTIGANDDTFTLFLEYADGQQKLVRVRTDNVVDKFVETQSGPGTEIGNPVRAALVGCPTPNTMANPGLVTSFAECYFVPQGLRIDPRAFSKSLTVRSNVDLDARNGYESVVCFKNMFGRQTKMVWFREALS